MIELRGFRS